ncbi:D-amino-acid transaminase, chloroplastic-like [Typha angustifolia]|uniref:D-amino-acid transaminase, chloroplastic-like n=1 Tax=Typha angustifolia TaxID=59011 RepID=UPI003C2C3FED
MEAIRSKPNNITMPLSLLNTPFRFPPSLCCINLPPLPPARIRLSISCDSYPAPAPPPTKPTTLDDVSDVHPSYGKPGEDYKDVVHHYVPVYSSSEVVDILQEKCTPGANHQYQAMYSSFFGGITLDPSLMVIPMDDHMVHRGHGVFDTTMLFDGYLYELDAHLDRFLVSASKAKISSPFSCRTMRSILIQLAAASKCKTGSLRYWLSAGPGNFALSPAGCPQATFYAVVISQTFSQVNEGVRIITSSIPMKAPLFATMKSVNYIPNVHSKMEAEEKGAFASIWVDGQGYVAEGPNANVAFISKNKELMLPLPDKILCGCTSRRLLVLAKRLVERGLLKSVIVRDITVEEAKDSAEMMFVSSLLPILPITSWDNHPIGDGRVGELTLALSALFWEDITSGPKTRRIPVPYKGLQLK